MKYLLLIMIVALASATTCRNDRDSVNCATEVKAVADAVTAANQDVIDDAAMIVNKTETIVACIKDKGANVTDAENVTTLNTTCASDDCVYAAVSPVKSKEYMALYQCTYSACGCGTLGSVAKTMSFGLLLAFGAWLMK